MRIALIAAALSVLPLIACTAPTDDADGSTSAFSSGQGRLLALGDSITFGWDPLVERDLTKVDAKDYRSFADDLGDELGLAVDNGACVGEASGSFVDPEAEDNGCRSNHAKFALHTDWKTKTQLDFTKAYLADAMAAKRAPELITLTIGGNDLLLLARHSKGIAQPVLELARLPFYLRSFGANLSQILKAIDATGYKGTVVVVTTYSLDYSDKTDSFGIRQLNSKLRDVVEDVGRELEGTKVKVADAYTAFEKVADAKGGKTCETGLLIPIGNGRCDVHPTPEGHALLAKTIRAAAGR